VEKESTVKFIVNDHMVLIRAPEGSLAPYIASFSEWVIGQGYAQCSLRQRVRIAAGFSRWLAAKSVPLNGVSYQHAAQYLRHRAHRQRVCEGDATALRQFLDFLRTQGAIPAEKRRQRQPSPAERCAQAYERYLREERVLAKATIANYVPFAHDFLKDWFGSGPVRLSRLRAEDVPKTWCDLSSVGRHKCT
jgi:integrase/recombinase XerD